MRITQSMLSNNMLRNLSSSYGKMSKLQDQVTTGKKFTRPSDDPVATIKGMGYRTDLNKVNQFERNINTVHSWLDSSDDALGEVGDALHRVKELVVQAANDTNTVDDRKKIQVEINQIRQQIQDIANTKVADKYIFSGTNTQQPLFIDVEHEIDGNNVTETFINAAYTDANGNPKKRIEDLTNAVPETAGVIAPTGSVEIEVFDGINLQVNTPGADLFGRLDALMGEISETLVTGNGESISKLLGGSEDTPGVDDLSKIQNLILESRAGIGARQSRVEMMENRLSLHEINVTKQMSNNEDIDYEKSITEMITQESIHRAALSVGARIIQPSLTDFLR